MAEFYYYNHSVNSRSHPALMAIIRKYGIAGYGHFHMILEEVYASHNPILDLSEPLMLDSIASEHLMTNEELTDFIDDCCRVGLLNRELWCKQRHITSDGICDAFSFKEKKSSSGKKGGMSTTESRDTTAKKAP